MISLPPITPYGYTMPEVAALLGCHLLTVHRHIKAGRLPAIKAPGRNGRVEIPPAALDAFLAERVRAARLTMSTEQAAIVLGVRRRTVERLVARGALRATRAGRTLQVSRTSVRRLAADPSWTNRPRTGRRPSTPATPTYSPARQRYTVTVDGVPYVGDDPLGYLREQMAGVAW